MPTQITIPIELFREYFVSHAKLSQAEYNRNPAYNDTHFAYKAELKMCEYLQEKEPTLFEEILNNYEK